MTMQSELVVAVSESPAEIGVNRTGLAVGVVLGAMHLLWALLVAAGVAQRLMDFIFRLHFIQPVYVVQPFDALRALALVLLAAASGYFIGAVFAFAWNWLHR